MFRIVTILCSAITLLLAYMHQALGGLVIGLHQDGSKWYSDELVSSGGDESFLVALGFGSFILPLVSYLVKQALSIWLYIVNVLFLYGILLLVNLNVTLIDSIKYGDYLLAGMVAVIHIPFLYCVIGVRQA